MNLATKVGVWVGDPQRPSHVALAHEPPTGALLRTKGRLYVLVDVERGAQSAYDAAVEAAETLRDEYYYDHSAGIEVSLRRAILKANRQVHAKLQTNDALHLACAVLCRNEVYAAKVGRAEIYLVRHARLFVPGAEPGELQDYVHLGQRLPSPPLGTDLDLAVSVWREQAQPGDTFVLGGGRLVDAIGLEEMKTALLTLHPVTAAHDLYERAKGRSGTGTLGVIVVELTPTRPLERFRAPAEAVDAETEELAARIGEQLDAAGRSGLIGAVFAAIARPFARPLAGLVGFMSALLPRASARLPRAGDIAAARLHRRQRLTAALALLLVVASTGVLALAYRDFQESNANSGPTLALVRAQQGVDAARAAADKKPPDITSARAFLEKAEAAISEAAASGRVDAQKIADLRAQIAALREQLTQILLDLATADPKSAPVAIDYAYKDNLYVADPGVAKLWRVTPDGKALVLAQKGQDGIDVPKLVSTANDSVIYTLDAAGRLFRYEGATRREIVVKDKKYTEPVAFSVFSNNLYVLDRASGQVWKYETTADGQFSAPAIPYLAQAVAPGTARSLAVDGDVWVTTDQGQVLRFRRSGATAAPLEFAIRWAGDPAKPIAVQAREGQHAIYVLDASARRVIQLARDGREILRVALPGELVEPSAFVVLEELGYLVTLHGTKLARTDLPQ